MNWLTLGQRDYDGKFQFKYSQPLQISDSDFKFHFKPIVLKI